MSACLVYVTASDKAEAEKIGRTAVEEKLAACANVLGGHMSIYRWQGEVQQDQEVGLLLKTMEGHVAALTERILALHSYDCPCVVTWPLTGGNPDFLAWIESESKP
ncbi:MAG: divalent-cation tolerance protein CutA [Rhodospirillaceae bacterium]|nr:divalent-cation tolerance protein CutA [Rhodospirillaceae bacterium]HAA91801.1 divalent-cation tolerance protein CutA [Rhodospirillaceae bacterium]